MTSLLTWNDFLTHLKWFPHPWQLNLVTQFAPASFSSPTWSITKITMMMTLNMLPYFHWCCNVDDRSSYLNIMQWLSALGLSIKEKWTLFSSKWPPWQQGAASRYTHYTATAALEVLTHWSDRDFFLLWKSSAVPHQTLDCKSELYYNSRSLSIVWRGRGDLNATATLFTRTQWYATPSLLLLCNYSA